MFEAIKTAILAGAAEKAAHDGVALGPLQIHAAVNDAGAMLSRAAGELIAEGLAFAGRTESEPPAASTEFEQAIEAASIEVVESETGVVKDSLTTAAAADADIIVADEDAQN